MMTSSSLTAYLETTHLRLKYNSVPLEDDIDTVRIQQKWAKIVAGTDIRLKNLLDCCKEQVLIGQFSCNSNL